MPSARRKLVHRRLYIEQNLLVHTRNNLRDKAAEIDGNYVWVQD